MNVETPLNEGLIGETRKLRLILCDAVTYMDHAPICRAKGAIVLKLPCDCGLDQIIAKIDAVLE